MSNPDQPAKAERPRRRRNRRPKIYPILDLREDDQTEPMCSIPGPRPDWRSCLSSEGRLNSVKLA